LAAQLGPCTADGAFAAGLQLLAQIGELEDAGPVALAIEDLHWADTASRLALLTVARRLREDRVLMLVTGRPDGCEDGWERLVLDRERCLPVRLDPLSVGEVAALAELTGVTLTNPAAARLHQHTGGLAIYVRMLLKELSQGELNNLESGLAAPRSLASGAVAAMAGLPPESRRLAWALAVINQPMALARLAGVAQVGEPAPALESLLGTGYVSWSPEDAHTPVQFSHPLYRAAVYNDLPPTVRQELHRAAAALFDERTALAHRVAATDHADDALARELVQAADRETAAGDRARAARFLLWAARITSEPDLGEQHLLRSATLLLANQQLTAVAGMKPEIESCRATPLRDLVLGMLAWDKGDPDTAERCWRSAIAQDSGPGSDTYVMQALGRLGLLCAHQIRAQEALEFGERALALSAAAPDYEPLAWTVVALADAHLRGAPAGLERLARYLPKSPVAVPPPCLGPLVTRGMLGLFACRTRAALLDLRHAIRLARGGVVLPGPPRAHVYLAYLLIDTGDWDEALAQGRVALSLMRGERVAWIEAQAHAGLATVYAHRGQWDAATAALLAARQAAEGLKTVEAQFAVQTAEATLAQARGQHDVVVERLWPLAGAGDPSAIPMISHLVYWPAMIIAMLESGDAAGAAVQVGQLEQAAAERRLDLAARITDLRARVACAAGRADESATLFEEAISLASPDDPVLFLAGLHHAFGRLLRARGDRREAIGQLRQAHELFSQLGAQPWVARVGADLEACGLRAQVPAQRSSLDLTDREQDVASLVAKGLTNREVAGELYISVKAVEFHLGHVYGKLGITSRRQLRDKTSRLVSAAPSG
jgi:tetratricopeptide (TPR) repeat protein